MKLLFNSRDVKFKKPFGAVKTSQEVEINFPIKTNENISRVQIFIRSDHYENHLDLNPISRKAGLVYFQCKFSLDVANTYFYRFEITTNDNKFHVGRSKSAQAMIGDWLPEWQLTVSDSSYVTPDWIKGGIIYHIFADRFARVSDKQKPTSGFMRSWFQELSIADRSGNYYANDFFGGNIKGIISKLDYLKSLSVSTIYLSPIFISASNHRYDTGDYFLIDPLFGTQEEFKELINKAKNLGISIILDGVFNHTGADSLYFNKFNNYNSVGAYQSQYSPFYNWYTFYHFPDNYECWWGVTICPTISRNAIGFQDMIAGPGGVIEKWTSMGVKGWRLDVVDEISDDFVSKIRHACKKEGDVLLIGEVWEDASVKVSYGEKRKYLLGDGLDGVMNYPYKNAIIDLLTTKNSDEFINTVYDIGENYPKDALDCSMTLLGTHDTERIINVLSGVNPPKTKKERLNYKLKPREYNQGKKLLYIASAIQYFLPGVPSVYYGDEAGLEGFEDPINRRPFPLTGGDLSIVKHYKKLGELRSKFENHFKSHFKVTNNNELLTIDRAGLKLIINLFEKNINIPKVKDLYSSKSVDFISPESFIIVEN